MCFIWLRCLHFLKLNGKYSLYTSWRRNIWMNLHLGRLFFPSPGFAHSMFRIFWFNKLSYSSTFLIDPNGCAILSLLPAPSPVSTVVCSTGSTPQAYCGLLYWFHSPGIHTEVSLAVALLPAWAGEGVSLFECNLKVFAEKKETFLSLENTNFPPLLLLNILNWLKFGVLKYTTY